MRYGLKNMVLIEHRVIGVLWERNNINIYNNANSRYYLEKKQRGIL